MSWQNLIIVLVGFISACVIAWNIGRCFHCKKIKLVKEFDYGCSFFMQVCKKCKPQAELERQKRKDEANC